MFVSAQIFFRFVLYRDAPIIAHLSLLCILYSKYPPLTIYFLKDEERFKVTLITHKKTAASRDEAQPTSNQKTIFYKKSIFLSIVFLYWFWLVWAG